MAQTSTFKNAHSFEKRKEVSSKILQKYHDRIPVIVERAPNSNLPHVEKEKYLVPTDVTVGRFLNEIRKQIKLDSEQALFIFVNKTTSPPNGSLMTTVYKNYHDEDGFLYVTYSGESIFG